MPATFEDLRRGQRFSKSVWNSGYSPSKGLGTIGSSGANVVLGPICDTKVTKLEDHGCNYKGFAVVSDSCFTCPLSDCYFDGDHTEVQEFIKTTVCTNGHPLKEFLRTRTYGMIPRDQKIPRDKQPKTMYCVACEGMEKISKWKGSDGLPDS